MNTMKYHTHEYVTLSDRRNFTQLLSLLYNREIGLDYLNGLSVITV